ncbi:MAG TPA: bifunctional nuclease family protein [Methylomirabilota bacterium]
MPSLRSFRRLVLLLAVSVPLVGAREPSEVAPPAAGGPQEVSVVGVFSDPRGQHGVLLESKRDKQRRFLMVIGAAEATAIAVPLENITPPRPLTHDLFLTLFGKLHVAVSKVVITDLRNNTYYATLYLTVGGSPMELDSRPSDAIALAIRAKAPVFAEERVFEKADRVPGLPGAGERI